jgi:hypothetical protein
LLDLSIKMRFSSIYLDFSTFFVSSIDAGYLSQYSVWLRTGWSEVRYVAEREDFSSSLCVQTSSGAYPRSYPMGSGVLFRGCQARPGRYADHSPPSSAEVKNE